MLAAKVRESINAITRSVLFAFVGLTLLVRIPLTKFSTSPYLTGLAYRNRDNHGNTNNVKLILLML